MNIVQTVADAVRKSDPAREASCHLAARLIVSLPEGAAGHCHAHSSAHTRCGREAARSSWNQRRKDVAHVSKVCLHGRPPYCLVVPELFERLVGVSDASDMEKQAHVEHISDFTIRQIHAPRQGRSDQTRSQCRFDWQAVSEIGNDRKTAEKIREPTPLTHAFP